MSEELFDEAVSLVSGKLSAGASDFEWAMLRIEIEKVRVLREIMHQISQVSDDVSVIRALTRHE